MFYLLHRRSGELGPFNETVRSGPLTFGNVTLINGTTASPTGGAGAVQPHGKRALWTQGPNDTFERSLDRLG